MKIPLDGICIGTTSYVKNDKSSDILNHVKSISETVPILSIELGLEFSRKQGLRMYNSGIAKEGVGAGEANNINFKIQGEFRLHLIIAFY